MQSTGPLGLGALPWIRWVLGGLAIAALIAGGLRVAIWSPPRYDVRLNDSPLLVSRDLAEVEAAVDAWAYRTLTLPVTLTSGPARWAFLRSELGLTIDTSGVRQAIGHSVSGLNWWQQLAWSRVQVDLEAPQRWDLDRLRRALEPVASALNRPPIKAELVIIDRQPTIRPEEEGHSVEPQVIRQALMNLGNRDQLEVPITRLLPQETRDSLESKQIRTLVAEWSTEYDASIPRAENVERAARSFDGLILKPGEILSYNSTVGPVTSETGWKDAYVFVGGEIVTGVGGGVCQVATTLYGTALRANLEIMERHPHQLAVTYIDASQDAAIAPGWEDLKFRNTTLGYLMIEAEAGDGRVTFRMYGSVPEGQEVRIESQVLDSTPFPTRTVTDPNLQPGDQVLKFTGNPGLSSEAYRLVYRNGELLKRELLSRDSYLPTAQVILVGP